MSDPFRYIFRFCCDPGFNDEAEMQALKRYVREAHIDDVAVFANVQELNTGHMTREEQDVYLRADRQIYRRMEYWMESAVEEAFGISSAEYMQDDEMGALFFLLPADSSGAYRLCVQETKELPWIQIDVVDRLSVVELGEGVRNQ